MRITRPSPPATVPVGGPAAFTAVVAADGVRQWLSCAGPGPTTLVVIPGLGATAASWTPVLAGMRQLVRTCVYDRPGLGHSPARPDRGTVVDAGGLADELWALLHAADERGPYLVLGHSFGGLIARAFVARHRPAVSGLLLAEGVTPDDRPLPRYWTEAGHPVDLPASSTATRGGPRLGSLPLVVLSASEPDRDHLDGPTYGQPTWMTLLWERQQRAATALSSDAIQVVARSGHVLQQDDPPAVVTSVRALLATVRTGSPLECVHAWATVRAICR